MVKIKKEHMRKYGAYPETNNTEEDMVGWAAIWKKRDEDATQIDDMWRGKEIMVFVDPNQENENILDFFAEAPRSEKQAQKCGRVPVRLSRCDKRLKKI